MAISFGFLRRVSMGLERLGKRLGVFRTSVKPISDGDPRRRPLGPLCRIAFIKGAIRECTASYESYSKSSGILSPVVEIGGVGMKRASSSLVLADPIEFCILI